MQILSRLLQFKKKNQILLDKNLQFHICSVYIKHNLENIKYKYPLIHPREKISSTIKSNPIIRNRKQIKLVYLIHSPSSAATTIGEKGCNKDVLALLSNFVSHRAIGLCRLVPAEKHM
ncbi:hypothetical protein HanRHA438_Chr10g0441151 [Helianthus annuus]|nr:hypothetical protein HanRHA438_Chr10g0441151 [Helianthus annuus]